VEPQDRDLLSSGTLESDFEDGVEIREENLDGWGGCRAVSENMVVDNTLLARWRRLSPSFSVRLSLLMNDSFSEIHNRISKL
jgi:vacuolar-type H+-ATPase subunit E/Vma4